MIRRLWPVRVVAFALILSVMLAVWSPLADAHNQDQSYLYLDVGEQLVARLQMPLADLDSVLGIDFSGRQGSADRVIEDNADQLTAYAASHVQLAGSDGPWEMEPVAVRRIGTFVEIEFSVDHRGDFQSFDVVLDPFFDEIEDRDAVLLVANDLRRGVIENEASPLARFTPDERQLTIDIGDELYWTNLTVSVDLGIDHIRTGTDHILFIVALMLPSVVVWKGQWEPTERFRASLWKILKVMTMFTLAHSVTFTLAGLGLVPQPNSRIIETAIALSIVATALHNIRPRWFEREWLIAFAFGLFHGFGFASLVSELEASTGTQLVSLLGRNIGIEIGQVVVVLLIFPMLFAVRTLAAYRYILTFVSLGLAVAGSIWVLERLTDRETTLTRSIEQWVDYPRVLWFIAGATAAFVALRYVVGRSRPDWLRPTA